MHACMRGMIEYSNRTVTHALSSIIMLFNNMLCISISVLNLTSNLSIFEIYLLFRKT